MLRAWELALIDETGHNGIRSEHIDRVVQSLYSNKLTDIDLETFEYHCHKCGIDPTNFTHMDLDRLEEKLNQVYCE